MERLLCRTSRTTLIIEEALKRKPTPLFDSNGHTTNTYEGFSGKVSLWRARTPEEIVERVGTKVTQHRIRKSQPKAVTKALEIMGVTQ